ncbi:MAG: acyltransferase [Candidatus Acidiferrales bacterium]
MSELKLFPGDAPLREKRWPELDGLRGTAILLVFLLHYVTDSRTHQATFGLLYRFAAIFRLGWSGVDLFFVLSGFLIGGILIDARASSNYFRTFYIRRVHRILPVYYLWITLYAILGYAIMKSGSPKYAAALGGALHPVVYLLFLQNILSAPYSLYGHYMLSPDWSLAVEEQFYLVAPFLIRWLSLKRLTAVLVACVIGAPVLRYFIFPLSPGGPDRVYSLMPCRADALAMGMLAAIAWRSTARDWLRQRAVPLKIASGFLFLGACAMTKWMPGPKTPVEAALQYSWLASLYTSILLLALLDTRGLVARVARWSFLRECGRISYCFYLIHLGILGACHWIFFGALPRINDWQGLGVTVLAALLAWTIAQLSWKYLEKPLIDRGHAKTYDRGGKAAPA